MATRIKLKRSTTATVVPTLSNLVDGEVALNIADKKLYARNGSNIIEVANQKPNTGEVTTTMLAADITNGAGNSYYVASTGTTADTLASGADNGKHPDTPFLTLEKALTKVTSGDTIHIAAGTFQEVFPLTIPDGVTIKGTNLRSTQIVPTPATNDLNAFVLNGDVHISDLTVKDFFYNSGNDTGYAFVCASSLDSDRSPYLERVTVLTKGSVTSGTDPYGFAQGDAGRGAKLDGALFAASGIESAILFNEVTFIVPNSVGLLLTNGVRVEWLNSFIYFANEGIKGVQGATGRSGSGQTRLKLSGVSGTFSGSEVIYQLEDSFKSGTYARSGTTVTITRNAHGLSNGDVVYADFISGSATDNYYTIANVAVNTFELTDSSSGTTSGNVTYKKADAYGTITTNDGTYLLINGKGVGEFTTGVPIAKVGVTGGDAKLDTAQKKFGTASLELDGTADNLTYPTTTDFGFGTTNWAAECFIRPSSVTGTQYIFDFRNASATDTAPTVYLDGTALHFGVGNTSQATGGTLALNTWYHVAVARSGGSTKLFLNGTQVGSTYTDTNDYGTTKPLAIGSDYNSAANAFAGHIDEVRVSKASARYTTNFTSTTSAFGNDLNTVLLIHFDGTDGATTITDSSGGVKDIRSSGGDSATSILTADYAQFGAELRGISSANIYGTKGAIADGAGVKILLTAHNFAYVGSGADFTNDPSLAVPANEVTETNGGKIFYSATNQNGDFRVGDAFVVDQATGNVQFQSTSTSQEAANITLSDATGTTKIFPAFVETGNLRLGGNTISSTSGSVIVDPSANEDILLNAQTIIPEELYFDTTKIVSFSGNAVGQGSFGISGTTYAGFSSYGLNSNNNFTLFNVGLATVTIDNEGSGYEAGVYSLQTLSNPTTQAAATTTLDTANGSVKSVTITNRGNDYTTSPELAFSSGAAVSTVTLRTRGRVATTNIISGGTGYSSAPTIEFSAPASLTINTNLQVNSTTDAVTSISHNFIDDDQVIYSNGGGSDNIGLTSGTTYYIVNSTTDSFKLAATSGGSAINLTQASGAGETHTFTGITATGTAALTGDAVSSITITNKGSGYITPPTITFTGANTTPAAAESILGFQLGTITMSTFGTGYAQGSAPTISFTNATGDTTGSGAAATANLGFPIASITMTNNGLAYAVEPTVTLSGGSPTTDAGIQIQFSKKNGNVTSIELISGGINYSTAPTVVFEGGKGSGATLNATILPLAGSITSGGSGYAAGTYTAVPLTGGNPTTPATATITITGLSGSITTAGSGYTDGPYTSITTKNVPTGSAKVVTAAARQILKFDYGVTQSWDVANSGNTAYVFSNGSPNGNNISITANVGDTLTFNMSAAGHPLYIQKVSGAYDVAQIVTEGTLTGAGQDSGVISWATTGVTPGTYYYVCGNHSAMGGTITISAYSGATFSASDTITGNTSGASGTATFVGVELNGTQTFMRFATVSSGPFTDGETITNGSLTARAIASTAQSSGDVYLIDGVETPVLSLSNFNTHEFDLSDSSLGSHPLFFAGGGTDEIVSVSFGTPGTTGAILSLVVTNSASTGNSTYYYACSTHGVSMGNNINVTNGSGSPGNYGHGATLDITVTGGAVTAATFNNQGSLYKATDTITVDSTTALGGGGSNFVYTIGSNDTSVSSVTNISTTGGAYAVSDVLSVDDSTVGGGGGTGFQFTVSKVGFVDTVVVDTPGRNFTSTDTLVFTGTVPTTSGVSFAFSPNTTQDSIPFEIQSDGSITTSNWSINATGAITSTSITTGAIGGSTISASGAATIGATLSVTGVSTFSGNIVANGTDNQVNNATIDLKDGTEVSPSLKFESSTGTGLFRESADTIGIATGGTAKVKIGTADIETTNNIKVDSGFSAPTPFFFVDATNENVNIGTDTSGLKFNNNASIESIGSDTDIDISISPKGAGNLILTGGINQDFSITDGSSETFRVDTESGDTTINGKLDVSKLSISQNIVSNNSSTAVRSFGEVTALTVTGSGSGYTNGTYTQTATTGGSGTGLTVDVTVASGTFSAVTVYDKGQNYKIGDTITITAAGGGTGLTVTVSNIDGQGIVLKPSAGRDVLCDTTGSLIIPSGTTNERPNVLDRITGAIRFNTSQLQFEGFNGNDFVSLGGVRDVDQDTYVLTESSPGADEDTFEFYNQGVNSLSINKDKITLRTAKTFDVAGTATFNGTAAGNPLSVTFSSADIFKVRSKKDIEIDGGFRLRGVPVQGAVDTIGTVTSVAGNYGTSQTYNAVASSGQFEGIGATFTVTSDGSGNIASVVKVAGGSNYEEQEIITIAGNVIGGATPAHDISFPVTAITNTVAAKSRLDVLSQDYVTQLDSKEFVSLDGNGAQAAWKINRGWNAGTTSYLTVFDSTATFMELDDCRVEGGELASFPSTATIIQFDKTAFKGAKTLITIESDDNKVHMLEVTTVCASNGTTAHATVTNSITSDNNLMDATISVVGNNVNISLAKSSAASSSSNFTGRFTTTKVKV